ncbi:MAG: Gfo/Idh/MocA family oxidoreductase [Phycisphaeraceae bacterium]
MRDSRVQMVAVCDVDAGHRENAARIAGVSGSRDVTGEYEKLLARDDIDAVMIGTPDHWHVPIAVAAARAGKDIYCEKPVSLYVTEGRTLVDVVQEQGRILQTGTWRRSRAACRRASELAINGYLGDLKRVEVGIPEGFGIRGGFTGEEGPQPVPETLDYDRWLGPAPEAPYTAARVHFNFRWILDYSAGYITDWGAHYLDVAHWGIGADGSGPREIEGTGKQRDTGIYDAPTNLHVRYAYDNGVEIHMRTTDNQKDWGIRFIGSEADCYVENVTYTPSDPALKRVELKDSDTRLYESVDHHKNFIDGVLERKATAAPVEVAHSSAVACHLGTIAALTGRSIKWDPKSETIDNDPEASAMLTRSPRAGYSTT